MTLVSGGRIPDQIIRHPIPLSSGGYRYLFAGLIVRSLGAAATWAQGSWLRG